MPAFHALALALVLTAEPSADPAAVRITLREALRDAAPMPLHAPVLPESGGLPGAHETHAVRAMKRDAERVAVEHAKKDASQAHHEVRHETNRHGEMGDGTHGEHGMGEAGCDAAEMMRSRGTMPGGDHSLPGGSPHHGM
jgi:hypothetical protein